MRGADRHERERPAAGGAEGTEPSARRVLVAECDGPTAAILRHRLEREGWRVLVVPDGAAAQAALADGGFALVVLEVKLPGTNGFEVLRQLRRSAGPQPPVILFSSSANEQDLVRGFELGADDYLFKPFSPVEFIARARRLVRRHEEGA